MGKHIKTWNILSRLLFLLVFVVSIGVFFMTHTGDSWVDFAINMAFDAIAVLFLVIYFETCARPLAKAVWALDSVTRDIRSSGDDQKALWARYSRDRAPLRLPPPG
ncbi:MAG: hypothetical protein LUH36_01195 [Oscillospiraceae bacterium]|nr:hypothetical protein [Oscillospiraceae bacterium]